MPASTLARLRRAARLPDPDAPSDADLLARFARDRDEAAFAELVRRHGPMVLAVARGVLGNAADADDAFQAAFLVLARKAGRLAGVPAVGGWLHGVARRAALKARRAATRRTANEAAAARPEVVGPPADPPDWLAVVEEEVGRLPDKYRLPVVLCGVCGTPRADVAAALGVPAGTLASRLAAGRKRLADRLRRRGVAVPVGLVAVGGPAAVSPELTAATVRAATGAVSPAVSELATEVIRAMTVTKLRGGVGVLAAGLLVGAVGPGGSPSATADSPGRAARPAAGVTFQKLTDAERAATHALKGTWELQSRTVDGTTLGLGERKVIDGRVHHLGVEYHRLTFGDRTVRIETKPAGGRGTDKTVSVSLNPTADPAQITLYGDDFLTLGVYRLDGDALEIAAHGLSGSERPRGFDPKDKRVPDLMLDVDSYRRVKPDDAKPKGTPPAAGADAKEDGPHIWVCQFLDLGVTGYVAVAGPWGTKDPAHYSVGVERKLPDGSSAVCFDAKYRLDGLPAGFAAKPVKEVVRFDPALRLVTFDLGGGQEARYKLPAP